MQAELARAQALLSKKHPNTDKAIKMLRSQLKKNNRSWMIYHYLGVAMLQKADYSKGLEFLLKALEEGSSEPETYHLVSVAYHNTSEFEQAIRFANEAISRNREFLEAWINLGAAHRALAQLDEAMKAYSEANRLDPKNAGIAYRIGSIYLDQGDLKKARELYEITTKMEPTFIEAYLGQALIHLKIQEYPEAVEKINEALKIDPKNRLSRIQLAVAFKDWGKYTEAIKLNEKLLKENPRDGRLRVNYALCLLEVGRFNEAEKNYLRALKDSPEAPESLSNYLMGIHYNPERTKDEIYDAHLLWDKHFAPGARNKRPVPKNINPDKKLRVGFISGGFRKHPVGWMITRAIENLPKDQIEVYGYTTHAMYDSLTMRIRKRCDKWTSVLGYTDKVVARILKDDEIDILVELSGHSAFNRLKTVTLEPVPITIKWVGGLFNTTGLESMDYLLTDHCESPEGEEGYYTEKLVRMPDDYVCYEPPEYDISVGPLPYLYNRYITFGCFNNPSKLNDQLIEHWADILHKIPKSKLFLKSKQYDTDEFVEQVASQFNVYGIDRDRINFEGYAMHEDLLASYNQVDIALDPWPYSGGLTTCEALWMGVPVVTHAGPTFAGKHSVTHLTNSGNAEWVTENWDDYKAKVIELASEPKKLQEIRSTLREQLLSSPLCDGPRFGAHLTKAFREMWNQRVRGYNEQLEEGVWQDHINVQPYTDAELEDFKNEHSICDDPPFLTNFTEFELDNDVKIALPKSKENFTHFTLIENKDRNKRLLKTVSELVSPGDEVIEIGAGYGVLTFPIAHLVGKNGKMLSLEPNPNILPFLKESRRLNVSRQLDIVEIAACDVKDTSYLFVGSNEDEGVLNTEKGTIPVETNLLDAIINEFKLTSPRLCVIDIECGLSKLLAGAKEVLSKFKPTICLGNSKSIDATALSMLEESGYRVFEHIEEVGVLSKLEPEQESSARWLFALQAETENKLKNAGFIFHEDIHTEIEPSNYVEEVRELEWTKSFYPTWLQQPELEAEEQYFRAINILWEIDKNSRLSAAEKAVLSVEAATTLLDLYSANPGFIPVACSLSRAFVNIGKFQDAASVLKNVFEQVMASNAKPDLSLPFLLPLKAQETGIVSSDGLNWLKVKVVEAWLLLQNPTTYRLQSKEIKFLKRLSNNPDSLQITKTIAEDLLADGMVTDIKAPNRVKSGKFLHIIFNHVYAKTLLDVLELTNSNSDQEHQLLIEKHTAIENVFVNVDEYDFATLFNYQHDIEKVKKLCMATDIDGIFFHGIFLDWQKKLVKHIGSKKHIGWYIWGGDLYNPIRFGRPMRFLAGLIDSIHTAVDGDITLYKDHYGESDVYTFAYPYAGLYGEMEFEVKKSKPPLIIVGNSGDKGNNHIEILQQLATKEDIDGYEILIPASYNFSVEYEGILQAELNKLGLADRTTLLKEFMPPHEYVKLIASAELFIGAHNRQQALGNLMASLYGGCKTLIRRNIVVNGVEMKNPGLEFLESFGFQLEAFEALRNIKALSEIPVVSAVQRSKQQEIIRKEFGIEQRSVQIIASSSEILNKTRSTHPILEESMS